MAFGINRDELHKWKQQVRNGEIAFLTHYWMDERFPGCHTVTKVGCSQLTKLISWGLQHGLKPNWIHHKENFPHFDLFGDWQKKILYKEQKWDHIRRFKL